MNMNIPVIVIKFIGVLVILLLVDPQQSLAQVDSVTVSKPSILNADTLIQGIYKTFDEFRRNKPFHTGEFKILKANRTDKVLINGNNDELIYQNIKGKTKQHGAQRFFGYCQNDTIRITTRFRYDRFGHGNYTSVCFCPIKELGHLSIIRFYRPIGLPISSRTIVGSDFAAPVIQDDLPFEKLYILDFMTGEISTLRYYILHDKFSAWDRTLYAELHRSDSRNDPKLLIEFVRRFNERNPIRF